MILINFFARNPYIVSNLLINTKRIKDTHREKAPSNKTLRVRKSTDVGVLAAFISNQLSVRVS